MSAHNIQLFSGAVDIPDDLRVTSLTVGDGLMELGANGAFANVGYVMNNPGGSNAAVYYDKISDQLRVVHTDFGGKEDPNTVTIKNEDITLNVAGNTHSRFYYGDGGLLSNLVSDLQSVTAVEANSDQMIILSNATALWANVGNVLVEGNVTAGEFHGDAGWLSNVQIPLEEVIMNGNTTSNIVEFHNALSLVTTGNVGIQNVAPLGDLSIGANVVFDDDATDILKIQGNVNVHRITIGEWVLGGGGAQGLQQITDTGNTTTITSEFNNTSTAFVTAAKAGIGTSTPSSDAMLHVDGHVRLGGPADTPNNEEMKVRVAGALNIIANHSNTDNTTSNLVMKAGEINAASITLAGAVTDEDRQKIVFKTREVEALTIDRFGNANFVSNVVVASGAKFIGDGSGLTGLVSDLQSVSVGGATTNQTIKFTNATEGANITSNLYVGSNLHLDDVTLAAASVTLQGVTTNGATTTDAITITDTTEATTTSTGALKVSGGIAAAKDIRAANVVVSRVGVGLTAGANPDPAHLVEVDGNVKATNVICESLTLDSVALQTLYSLDQVVNVNNTTSNIVIISNTTPSTSMSTGCLQLSGGLGVNGNVYAQEFVNTNAGGWRLTHTHSTRPTVNGASVGGELTGGSGDVETGFLRLSGGGSTAGTGASKSYIDICGASASTDFANNITFGIKGSEKVRLTDVGLGVGLTSPAFPLDVDGVSRSRGVVVNSGFGNNTARPALTSGTTHPSYEIRSIGGNGNVGSTGSDDGFLRLRAGGGTGTGNVSYIDLSGYSVYSGDDMKRNIVFGTSGTERMRIKEDGSVGIGIASPEAVLHVKDTSNDSATTSAESVSYATQRVQVKNSSSMSLYTGSISGGIYQQVANYNGATQYPLCLNPYGGKVAIGGTSPLSPLHIRGNNCRLLIADSSEDDADTNNFNCGIAFVDNTYDGTTTYAGNPAAGMGFFIGHLSGGSKEVNVKNLTGELSFGTRNVHQAMYINNDGNVGVGKTDPGETLHVVSSRNTRIHIEDGGSDNGTYFPGLVVNGGKPENDQTVMVGVVHDGNTSSSNYNRIGWYGGSGDRLYFNYLAGRNDYGLGDTTEAYLTSGTSGNGAELNFTGQHRCFIHGIPHSQASTLEGLIVSADNNKYIKMSGGIEVGSNAITTNESLPLVSLSTKVNDKKCFGVISASEDPETREDAFGSFVTVSQKETGDTRVYINSVGEGAMWVTDINGPLESGDYITTSNVAGYGMKQDDDVLHNYTVAKITMDCDFEPATQPVQQIVKELSNVNYWVETTYTNVALEEYSNLAEENRQTVTENETVTYQKIEREESTTEKEGWMLEVREELVNVLDEHGQLQWEDHPTDTEQAYKIRYLTADGTQTDEANAVHVTAFVGCTYHCG